MVELADKVEEDVGTLHTRYTDYDEEEDDDDDDDDDDEVMVMVELADHVEDDVENFTPGKLEMTMMIVMEQAGKVENDDDDDTYIQFKIEISSNAALQKLD